MSLTEKLQSVFVIIAILLGLILGQIKWVEEHSAFLIVPSLMVMLYGVFLNIPFKFGMTKVRDLATSVLKSVCLDCVQTMGAYW